MPLPEVAQHNTVTYLLGAGQFDGLLQQLLTR